MKLWPTIGGAAAVLLLFAFTFAWWHWAPLRVLDRTQDRLQRQVERRNWENVGAFLADDYADDWGQSKDTAIESGAEVLRHFFFLNILQEGESARSEMEDGRVVIARRLLLEGSGSAIATMIVQRVNEHPGRFLFTWKREPGWPPTWKLVELSHENPAGPP